MAKKKPVKAVYNPQPTNHREAMAKAAFELTLLRPEDCITTLSREQLKSIRLARTAEILKARSSKAPPTKEE